MVGIIGLFFFIYAVIGLVKYINKNSLLKWRQYTYYADYRLKTLKEINLIGKGLYLTYRQDGSLLTTQNMKFLSILKDETKLYYPSGKFKSLTLLHKK